MICTVATLGYAILGLLAREPMTGYEISQRMQVPVGYMWSASHSQIYGELAALEDGGLIRHRVVAGRGPRENKRYSLSARGRRALVNWVDSPLDPLAVKSELMLRVRCFWLISPDRCRAFVHSILMEHERRLAVYEDEQRDFAAKGLDVHDPADWSFGAFATLQAGLRGQRAMIDWCQWLLIQLSNVDSDIAAPGSVRHPASAERVWTADQVHESDSLSRGRAST
jgi:DNA-binding PadR family transcriptional regulator